MRETCSCWQARYFLLSPVYPACVSIRGRFPPSLGNCCDCKQEEINTTKHVCVCVCVRGARAGRPQRSAVTAACPLFSRQASAALAALQDCVFSAVRFQRKAAKQNGNRLSQPWSCRWTAFWKHTGHALPYRRSSVVSGHPAVK